MTHLRFHRRPVTPATSLGNTPNPSTAPLAGRGRRIRRAFTNNPITANCNDELAVIASHWTSSDAA